MDFNLAGLFQGLSAYANQQNAQQVTSDNSMVYGVIGLVLGFVLCKMMK
jgi:high-affinity K+ transport system ATPase subunit B